MDKGWKTVRVIIYALGKIFERYKEKINWNQIIALADKNTKSFQDNNYPPVILPEAIFDLEYDFIAIFSNAFFEEIKMELVGKYFIPQEKIISWKELLSEEKIMLEETLNFYRIFLREKRCKKILDFGMSEISGSCLTKEELLLNKEIRFDGIWSMEAIENDNLYDHVYQKYQECREQYDVILLQKSFNYSPEEWEYMRKQARYLLLHTRCLKQGKFIRDELMLKLQRYGRVTCLSNVNGFYWIIDTGKSRLLDNLSVYVVTHKKYNLLSNEFYKPLCVGVYQKEGYLSEQNGENIAYLNSKINECTALYWIWKNTDTKYVGLNHYRRYFYANEIKSMDNYLDGEYACEILREYDIILPKPSPLGEITIFEQIRASIDPELCNRAYILFREKLAKSQPDYLQAFDNVMDGYNAFLCNMFVTRREILNQYCDWLFSFLIEAAEEMDVEGYDSYSQRVIGFFAERMWTVWLRKNRLRIKELPYVIVR